MTKKVGRRPLGQQAMTDAQRQAKRRFLQKMQIDEQTMIANEATRSLVAVLLRCSEVDQDLSFIKAYEAVDLLRVLRFDTDELKKNQPDVEMLIDVLTKKLDVPPYVRTPQPGKHPQPDELNFMRWHFERASSGPDAVERISPVTGRAASMILKHYKRFRESQNLLKR